MLATGQPIMAMTVCVTTLPLLPPSAAFLYRTAKGGASRTYYALNRFATGLWSGMEDGL